MRRSLTAVGLALALTTIAALKMGGWAVVSVVKVPDYLVVGKAEQLTFSVQQHGVSRLTDLSPTVTARSGSREVSSRAARLSTGGYRAFITIPEAGEWQIKIASGFGKSGGTLLPVRAIAAGEQPPTAPSEAERGRAMFAAKGCVTCHIHGAVDIKGELSDFGPDLTARRFATTYLEQYLMDPSIKPAEQGKSQMPKPDLRQVDIAPLIAFINAERKTAIR